MLPNTHPAYIPDGRDAAADEELSDQEQDEEHGKETGAAGGYDSDIYVRVRVLQLVSYYSPLSNKTQSRPVTPLNLGEVSHQVQRRVMSPILPQVLPQQNQPQDDTEDDSAEEEPRAGILNEYNDIEIIATLGELKIAQQFIAALQEASLDDDDGMDLDAKDQLKNPITQPIDLDDDPSLRAGIDIFLDTTNASDKIYTDVRESVNSYLRRLGVDPEEEVPSLHTVKKVVGNITGVHSIMTDMCPNTCIAYTGPFSELDQCPECNSPRYDPIKLEASEGENTVPQRRFYTIPLGPQIQALWRNPEGARDMRYRVIETDKILRGGPGTENYNDIYSGSDYLDAVESGKIAKDDMVLMLSIDGAQLYQSKQSDCWIYIWVLFDLAPDKRYKKKYVLPGGFIPGPNKPKNVDSFLFPGLHHAAALAKEGLRVWDADQDTVFTSNIFLFLGTADGPGMTYLNGLTGHSGARGCRLFCPVRGRRKAGANHYYPALLKPINYNVAGSDHPDVDGTYLPHGSPEEYLKNLKKLLSAQNQTQYQLFRKETGISKPSIFNGFPIDRILPVPTGNPGDIMHHVTLNMTDLLLALWRGTLDVDIRDDKRTWYWATLKGETWKAHGKRVAAATKYLPGSFDRPPRNPAEKMSSGYKAWEFLTYVYGFGPGFFYHILPYEYWASFCKLVRGIRLLHQNSITPAQLVEGHKLLVEFVQEFETLYYQQKESRLHFCRQSIHALLHIATEITRLGPPTCYSQWCMERTIGILGQEINQPSNPFQNLSERGLRRARINALENIIPDLAKPPQLPRVSHDLGDGYILLGSRDTEKRYVSAIHIPAVHAYFASHGVEFDQNWIPYFRRWARVRLPNKQLVRSAWKEKTRSGPVRISRNVMVGKLHCLD